jgi:beta-fructofuranosidase
VNNTSGFFPNQTNGVVAIYTLNNATQQTQEIAYSIDGGYTFTRYDNNPVLSANSTQFRDPKVIWYADHWVMVLAYAQEFTVGIFTSDNLKTWTHASNFSHSGLLGLQYECPNLTPIPMTGTDEEMWLLAISINPGAPLGGSIQQYFPGSFNGTHFTAVDEAARIADFGKDNYAAQYFYGIPGTQDQVSIGWASNWQYSQVVPTGELEGWRSSMGLPRTNRLANVTRIGWDLISYPYDLTSLYTNQLAQNNSLGNGSITADYKNVSSGAIYFSANVTGLTSTNVAGTLNFTFSASSTNESISGGYFFSGDAPFWLVRGKISGFDNPFFTDKVSTAIPTRSNGVFTLEGVIDRSIIEVFLNGGEQSATLTFFPEGRLDTMTIGAAGVSNEVTVDVRVWGLQSTWEQAAQDGIVKGNSTSPSSSSSPSSSATASSSASASSSPTRSSEEAATSSNGVDRLAGAWVSFAGALVMGAGLVL